MMTSRTVFIIRAPEDAGTVDQLTNVQGRSSHSPFRFTVAPATADDGRAWKDRVDGIIRDSDGVIVLFSRSTYKTPQLLWQMFCLKVHDKPSLVICMHGETPEPPPLLGDARRVVWPERRQAVETFLRDLQADRRV